MNGRRVIFLASMLRRRTTRRNNGRKAAREAVPVDRQWAEVFDRRRIRCGSVVGRRFLVRRQMHCGSRWQRWPCT